jgi:hypothetical protein
MANSDSADSMLDANSSVQEKSIKRNISQPLISQFEENDLHQKQYNSQEIPKVSHLHHQHSQEAVDSYLSKSKYFISEFEDHLYQKQENETPHSQNPDLYYTNNLHHPNQILVDSDNNSHVSFGVPTGKSSRAKPPTQEHIDELNSKLKQI